MCAFQLEQGDAGLVTHAVDLAVGGKLLAAVEHGVVCGRGGSPISRSAEKFCPLDHGIQHLRVRDKAPGKVEGIDVDADLE